MNPDGFPQQANQTPLRAENLKQCGESLLAKAWSLTAALLTTNVDNLLAR